MFSCSHCGAQSLKWAGRCGECQKWGTLEEEGEGGRYGRGEGIKIKAATVIAFPADTNNNQGRNATGIAELDRVLGGGLVKGQVILLAGEPGIGKSTLLAGVAEAKREQGVLYVAGEESPEQLALRFSRMNKKTDGISLLTETAVEPLVSAIREKKPALVIVDSIQTITTLSHDSALGAPTHLRAATAQFIAVAKELGIPIILVGQITKDGLVAGPKLLEHMVDTVLSFSGDTRHAYRILRATKNRFGATDEVGVFEMKEEGLVGVPDASAVFFENHASSPGTAVTSVIDGARAFILEVQALVNTSSYGTPVRRGSGFSTNRLQMLLAILEKHGKVSFSGADVYVNVVGGYAIKEPAADLAVLAALLSSKLDITLPKNIFFAGEVGLGGEIRPAPQKDRRAKEAARLGFSLPSSTIESISSLVTYIKSHSS